jgi:hypothetical protein
MFAALRLGETLRLAGRWDDATVVFDAGRKRLDAYLAPNPADVNLRFISASLDIERALVHAHRDGANEAVVAELAKGTGALEKLVEQFPGTASFRRRLAEGLTEQAALQRKAGNVADAAPSAARAIELLEELDRKAGSPVVFQSLLASAYLVAAEVELDRNATAAAKAQLEKADERMTRARAANDESPTLAEEALRIKSLLMANP